MVGGRLAVPCPRQAESLSFSVPTCQGQLNQTVPAFLQPWSAASRLL